MVSMAHRRRSRRQTRRPSTARLRRLPRLLRAAATVLLLTLTLTLSACASSELPSGCSFGGGDAPLAPPDYSLPVTAPVAADGVVYVGYAIPDPRTGRAGHLQDQYIIAALRERDGTPLWRVQLTSNVLAGGRPEELAIADGVVLMRTRGGSGELLALRASDGASLWHREHFAVLGTTWAGVLYTSAGGTIYALRLADGHLLWQQTSVQFHGLLTRLVADGTNLYFARQNGSVTALRADTGAVSWTFGPTTPNYTLGQYIPFAAAEGQVYLTYLTGTPDERPGIVRLNTVDGTSRGYVLHQPTGIEAGVFPLLAGGVVTALIYPPDYPDPITIAAYRVSLSAGSGQLLWRVPAPVQVQADVGAEAGVLAGGTNIVRDAQTVYFEGALQGASHAVISAFRLDDGTLLWRQQVPASTIAGVAVDSGYLFETEWGVDNPCSSPPAHEAPVIRALTSADGGVAWTQVLNAEP